MINNYYRLDKFLRNIYETKILVDRMGDIKKNLDIVKKNLDEIELLENLSSTGTWYLDLRTTRFTEISEKIFELYGISKGDSTS